MLSMIRVLLHLVELTLSLPIRLGRLFLVGIILNPRLGPLRHLFTLAVVYVGFALTLVYVVAPLRGWAGQFYVAEKLRYDAERWLATAIYDAKGNFVGTFDPRLDSQRDFNFTAAPIEVGNYIANPDHKSIPVRNVPTQYWQCLVYQEDRYLGSWLNPAGIDLMGVLKIPYSTITRSIRRKSLSLGVGGSTLPMQLARVIYNTPPHRGESPGTKIARKMREWWLAPVIYYELTRGGSDLRLQQWASNHIWLAQRTGGPALHGVEMTARIVFGKEAKDLSIAEQFVLASAVNKPIILLPGSDRLNAVRLDRWRYITEVRARKCAQALLTDEAVKKQVLFELISLASGPPDPRVQPKLQKALVKYSPRYAKPARANPVIRANVLIPGARLGLREQMKHRWGYGWREHVRGVTTTLEVTGNLALRQKIQRQLTKLDETYSGNLNTGYTLDPIKARRSKGEKRAPNVMVVAAMPDGQIVRYYESGYTAPYFGSPSARDPGSGQYLVEEESRMIASTGKIIAAIAIANTMRDGPKSKYIDNAAPARGLDTCRRKGTARRTRTALVSFACSLSGPIEWRLARVGQSRVRRIIDRLGFNMPPAPSADLATPPSTAAVRGLIAGSPRRVHQMSSVVLAALMGQGNRKVRLPTLVKDFDTARLAQEGRGGARAATAETGAETGTISAGAGPEPYIIPNDLIKPRARGMIKRFLQAPLCYRARGKSHGTLKSLSKWCAARRSDIRFHFAKTGTAVTADPDSTIDTWVTGGLQFSNGAAYSYVVVVGTGSAVEPWARRLHASQAAAPLVNVLLKDLAKHAKANPMPWMLSRRKLATKARSGKSRSGKARSTRARSGKVRSGKRR